jgi:CxxC motif-containing protein (DUF1111 family)
MRAGVVHLGLLVLVFAASGIAACTTEEPYEPGEELSGGETTVFDTSRNAFALTARNLRGERRDKFFVGNALFNRGWVIAPASTVGIDGLGPTFNATSCSSCHARDGRGAPPTAAGEEFLGLLLRISVPGATEQGGPRPDPVYGDQFNHKSVPGVMAEGTATVTYAEQPGAFADGTVYSLRAPTYTFDNLALGPMPPDVMVSPRVAPAVFGLGLLETILEADLLALADDDDVDGDGISGRANWAFDPRSGTAKLGRFGWKANQPSVEAQNAGAFAGDIGITSSLHPTENCPAAQVGCAAQPNGGSPELDDAALFNVTYYGKLLAVPARRDFQDATVLAGKRLFREIGCAGCHTPAFTTGTDPEYPELSGQAIRPYTDLLLHDMGEGLADHRPDFLADGREWRTSPLWGLGLISTVNRHTFLLHDGRARDVKEAILWHGGEAEASREAYRHLSAADRDALGAFLESL